MSAIVVAVLGIVALWYFDAPPWAFVLLIAQATCSWFAWVGSEMRAAALVATIRDVDARSETALSLQMLGVDEHASFAAKWSEAAYDEVKDLDVLRHSRREYADDVE